MVKKINYLKILEIIVAVVLVLAPAAVSYAALGDNFACDAAAGQNCGITSVNQLVKKILTWLLSISFGVAVLFLIVGGFWYITSAGNEETAEKGKNTAINAIIGIVIIVLSWVIINVVTGLVTDRPNVAN